MTAGRAVGGSKGAKTARLVLSRTPGHLIRRAQRVHVLLWARHVGGEPTGPQFAVLSAVAGQPGLDQATAGFLASLDKSSTADVVRRLRHQGWVTVDRHPEDKRRSVLHLSRPARAALHTCTTQVAVVQEELLAPLEPERRTLFTDDLATLAFEGRPPVRGMTALDSIGLDLSRTPGHLIRRAQQAYTVRWAEQFKGLLTSPQYAVLCALADGHSIDQASVGEAAALDKSSVAEVVNRLAGRGLVDVSVDRDDRRRKLIRLSAAATPQMADVTRAAAAVQAELLGLLPAARHETFLDELAQVAYAGNAPLPA